MHLFSRTIRAALAFSAVLMLVGCAHPINVGGDVGSERIEAQLIQKKVAYVMSDAQRSAEVVTPGGGGDRVKYFPYRDLEKSIRHALRSVYQEVVVIASTDDAEAVKASSASLIFKPEIKTDSGSPSSFTWPPTYFVTEISCVVTDPLGIEVGRVSVSGRGEAEFNEFKGDFGLAARRAAMEVTRQLGTEIRRNEKFR